MEWNCTADIEATIQQPVSNTLPNAKEIKERMQWLREKITPFIKQRDVKHFESVLNEYFNSKCFNSKTIMRNTSQEVNVINNDGGLTEI